MFKVSVKNEASPYLVGLPKETRKAVTIGLASTGKWLREEVRKEIDKGDPPLNPFSGTISRIHGRGGRSKELNVHRGRGKGRWRYGARKRGGGFFPAQRSTRTIPLLRLRGAVRSEMSASQMLVRVGYLRGWAQQLAAQAEEGFTTQISPRMRRMLFGIGVPLGVLRELRTPPRPRVSRVFDEKKNQIAAHFMARTEKELELRGYGLKR